jgi:hypothetical protein
LLQSSQHGKESLSKENGKEKGKENPMGKRKIRGRYILEELY